MRFKAELSGYAFEDKLILPEKVPTDIDDEVAIGWLMKIVPERIFAKNPALLLSAEVQKRNEAPVLANAALSALQNGQRNAIRRSITTGAYGNEPEVSELIKRMAEEAVERKLSKYHDKSPAFAYDSTAPFDEDDKFAPRLLASGSFKEVSKELNAIHGPLYLHSIVVPSVVNIAFLVGTQPASGSGLTEHEIRIQTVANN